MLIATVVAAVAAAAGPATASDKAAARFQASCLVASSGSCWDYAGAQKDIEPNKDDCVKPAAKGGLGGSWSTAKPCPSAARIGRCAKTFMGVTTTISTYPPGTPEFSKNHCKMIDGKWQDG